jgi:hypothetical protein
MTWLNTLDNAPSNTRFVRPQKSSNLDKFYLVQNWQLSKSWFDQERPGTYSRHMNFVLKSSFLNCFFLSFGDFLEPFRSTSAALHYQPSGWSSSGCRLRCRSHGTVRGTRIRGSLRFGNAKAGPGKVLMKNIRSRVESVERITMRNMDYCVKIYLENAFRKCSYRKKLLQKSVPFSYFLLKLNTVLRSFSKPN